MTAKKNFPLRINADVMAALQRWADDELRSANGQIEYVLRDALVKSGRVKLVQKVVTEVEEKTPHDRLKGKNDEQSKDKR